MSHIKPGQRWISAAEPELGLGTILRADGRQIDIVFIASGELKHFTPAASPLLRAGFERGDRIRVDGAEMSIDAVEPEDGILVYRCAAGRIAESVIDPLQPLLPLALRLLIGQCDAAHLFDLRRRCLCLQSLDQDEFEHFAMDLLGHYGFRLNPLSEHVFRIDAGPQAGLPFAHTGQPCAFGAVADTAGPVLQIGKTHELIVQAAADFLHSHAGNAGFLVDDGLAARSAVLETVFVNGADCWQYAIDALGNPLSGYQPTALALFRSRGSLVDLKPYRRSLERLYPNLLAQATTAAQARGAGILQAVRMVVGAEFAAFGRTSR